MDWKNEIENFDNTQNLLNSIDIEIFKTLVNDILNTWSYLEKKFRIPKKKNKYFNSSYNPKELYQKRNKFQNVKNYSFSNVPNNILPINSKDSYSNNVSDTKNQLNKKVSIFDIPYVPISKQNNTLLLSYNLNDQSFTMKNLNETHFDGDINDQIKNKNTIRQSIRSISPTFSSLHLNTPLNNKLNLNKTLNENTISESEKINVNERDMVENFEKLKVPNKKKRPRRWDMKTKVESNEMIRKKEWEEMFEQKFKMKWDIPDWDPEKEDNKVFKDEVKEINLFKLYSL